MRCLLVLMKEINMFYARILFVFLVLIMSVLGGYSSNNLPVYENYHSQFITLTTKDGLSNNHILDITQDRSNFLWIATLNGLNKYDGQTIKQYVHDPAKKNTIPPGIIYDIEVDEEGILWLGTEKGLFYYDAYNDSFKEFKLTFDNQTLTHVRAILNEGDSLLWIEDVKGYLLKYDKKTKLLSDFWKHERVLQDYYYYHQIYRDTKGVLWVGARNYFPRYLDVKADRLESLKIGNLPGMKKSNDVACYFEDSYGNFWVAGLDGAYTYDRKTDKFDRFLDMGVSSIIESHHGDVWFGTKKGIYQYDVEKQVMQHYLADINSDITLPDNYINILFEDKQGNIWIGTVKGLALYKASNEYLRVLNHIPANKQTISSNFITSSLLDKNNNLWIGHENAGIDILSLDNGSIKHLNKSNGFPSDKIKCFYQDSYGDIYVGLWEGVGFARIKQRREKEEIDLFRYYYQDTYKDWYKDFAEDSLGNFYVGFWGGCGLSLFDRKKGEFIRSLRYKFYRDFESRLITKLLYDSEGRLWMGTTHSGVHIYYPSDDTSECFFNQPSIKTSFEKLIVHDIYESTNGKIWIAADSLFCYEPETKSFKVWGKGKGLPNNNVYKILEDDKNNLWLGTERGILCFNPEWDYCLSFPDLEDMEMNHDLNAARKLPDGQLLFGGLTGMVIFDPETVINNQSLPDIMLTELKVKGEMKIPNLFTFSEIELAYHENFFTVGFSNTDLTSISKYSYRYRLIELEGNWNYIKAGNYMARYTNIKPGNYTLEIQLALNSSNWEDIKVKTLDIKITPPFWETYWFVLLVIAVVLSIAALVFRFVFRRMQTKRKMSELKDLLLRAQINPHFIFNALGAIQGYIYKKEEKEAGKYLAEFSKLIRLILENTKQEFITLEKEIQLLEYYLSLQEQRFKTKFTFSIEVDENIDLEQTFIPPMLAQPFVENAVEHGVTQRETPGHVFIKIKFDEPHIVYIIEDDGIGRKKSMSLKKGKEIHKSYGTEITEERLNLIKRKYRFEVDYQIEDLYEDNIAKGTRVTFKIPANLN